MASHSGNPKREIEMGYPISAETERQQADELVKRYVYSLSLGIKKVFWVTVTEFHDFEGKGPDTYFNHVGLINNPKNDGESHKKLSYYSYKLLVEKLEGVDLNKVETLNLRDDIFAYRFYRGGHKVYVLWSE